MVTNFTARKISSGSVPARKFDPQSKVSGRSVTSRIVTFGVLKMLFLHPLTEAGQKKFLEDYRKTQEAKPMPTVRPEAAAKR